MITLKAWLYLLLPPMLWAGNALVGRLMAYTLPPATFNLMRWGMAAILLLPWLGWLLIKQRSFIFNMQWVEKHLYHYFLLGFFGIACYNTLQYWALQSTSPLNVTLVAACTPVWMLILGQFFFHTPIEKRGVIAALFSILGVCIVMGRGQWMELLQIKWVLGDGLMVLASLVWGLYSWFLLAIPSPVQAGVSWATHLLAQIGLGLISSFALVGIQNLGSYGFNHPLPEITFSWEVGGAVLFVALGPSLLALRCWGLGVALVGPNTASLFSNFTPLFAALWSTLILNEPPQWYHWVGFICISLGALIQLKR